MSQPNNWFIRQLVLKLLLGRTLHAIRLRMRKKIIAGNWKMHGMQEEVDTFLDAFEPGLNEGEAVEIILFPPVTLLSLFDEAIEEDDLPMSLGAQTCHTQPKGAFTGEISADMLADIGCDYVLVGHSERRQFCGESDEIVAQKLHAALEAELVPVLCVGETKDEREAGQAEAVVKRQLDTALAEVDAEEEILIAYEPVWAIGTGLAATMGDIEQMHSYIKSLYPGKPVLYGGSVKPNNADVILKLPDVDGVLVGGASLDGKSFASIVAAAG